MARRADGLLFVSGRPDPQQWQPIIDAYLDAANAADAREAVTTAAVEAGFALDPFVMVAWADAIELLVLGPVEVRTDLPSVPVLSGTASATWVEHRVARPAGVRRARRGGAATAGTRLDAGAVAAGGFALALALDHRRRAAIGVARPRSSDRHRPTGTRVRTRRDRSLLDPEMTISPPAALAADVAAATAASRTPGLVRARRCTRGHTNPPHSAQCRTCDDLIGAASRSR